MNVSFMHAFFVFRSHRIDIICGLNRFRREEASVGTMGIVRGCGLSVTRHASRIYILYT